MLTKNKKWLNKEKTILSCELYINDEWVPCEITSDDPVYADLFQQLVEEGGIEEPDIERIHRELISAYTMALEQYYDSKAREKLYDNRYTCALRAGYPGPFQTEGQAFATWMDECNKYAYGVMNDVLAGKRSTPTITELIEELPELVWPDNTSTQLEDESSNNTMNETIDNIETIQTT